MPKFQNNKYSFDNLTLFKFEIPFNTTFKKNSEQEKEKDQIESVLPLIMLKGFVWLFYDHFQVAASLMNLGSFGI